jgi:hypothetical protein
LREIFSLLWIMKVVVFVARRQSLCAYNRQVRQLPEDLQRRECGLIQIGCMYARNFDAGHSPSGGGVQRVLTELRKLAERMASQAAEAATPVRSALDDIRTRHDARLAGVALADVDRCQLTPLEVTETSAGQELTDTSLA